jgi:hypothetical protein
MKLSRRTVLRGLLGGTAITVGLPPLEAMLNSSGTSYADGGALPLRFGTWFWGNGMLPSLWTPTGEGEGDAWALSEQLSPLAPVKHLITVVTGMEVRVLNAIPHTSGAAGFLTGIEPIGEEGDHTFGGPTVDQVVAAELGGDSRFRSLQTGARPGGGISFNGPHSSNPAESSPIALFERLFGEGFRAPGENTEPDPRLALRRSVLDAVLDRANTLRSRVGASDKARLDQHMNGIRELELRLARQEEDPPNLEACVRPEAPPGEEEIVDLSQRNRLLTDLLVMALACDQTRVFSHQLTHRVDNWVFPDTDAGHHQLTHDEPDPQPQVSVVVKQVMDEYRYMIEAMEAVPEGDGTLLSNSLMVATSGVSLGRTHALDEFPCVIAGSGCGRIKQDMHYRSPTRENASSVMLSLIRGMGILRPDWGTDDARVTDGLSAIEV